MIEPDDIVVIVTVCGGASGGFVLCHTVVLCLTTCVGLGGEATCAWCTLVNVVEQ